MGPRGRSGQVRKISPLPGFDPRTVQPVTSRYTDYATRPGYHIPELNLVVVIWLVMFRTVTYGCSRKMFSRKRYTFIEGMNTILPRTLGFSYRASSMLYNKSYQLMRLL